MPDADSLMILKTSVICYSIQHAGCVQGEKVQKYYDLYNLYKMELIFCFLVLYSSWTPDRFASNFDWGSSRELSKRSHPYWLKTFPCKDFHAKLGSQASISNKCGKFYFKCKIGLQLNSFFCNFAWIKLKKRTHIIISKTVSVRINKLVRYD